MILSEEMREYVGVPTTVPIRSWITKATALEEECDRYASAVEIASSVMFPKQIAECARLQARADKLEAI